MRAAAYRRRACGPGPQQRHRYREFLLIGTEHRVCGGRNRSGLHTPRGRLIIGRQRAQHCCRFEARTSPATVLTTVPREHRSAGGSGSPAGARCRSSPAGSPIRRGLSANDQTVFGGAVTPAGGPSAAVEPVLGPVRHPQTIVVLSHSQYSLRTGLDPWAFSPRTCSADIHVSAPDHIFQNLDAGRAMWMPQTEPGHDSIIRLFFPKPSEATVRHCRVAAARTASDTPFS